MKRDSGQSEFDPSDVVGPWYDQFVESSQFQELTEPFKQRAWSIIEDFARLAFEYADAKPADWDASVVEECCLEIMPRKVTAEPAFFEALGPVLSAFFKFLESKNLLPKAGQLGDLVKKLTPEIVAAAADTSSWGPAKGLAMGAIKEGVDIQDQTAMQKYMLEHNLRMMKNMADAQDAGRTDDFSAPYSPQPPVRRTGPQIGRNDPCHCGSGKKYKKCHLAQDQKNASTVFFAKADVADKPSGNKRAEYESAMAKAQSILEYMGLSKEIEAAGNTLEAHRKEFDEFCKDQEVYIDRVQALFEEERFVPLRYTGADIKRAFEKVGTPKGLTLQKEDAGVVKKAILFLADSESRSQLSMKLLTALPEYVKAGRYIDAWIIQIISYEIAESVDESNAFLSEMFTYGYEEWADEQQGGPKSLFKKLGMDAEQLGKMSPQEIEAWLRTQESNPVMMAQIQELVAKNPSANDQAFAQMQAIELEAIGLLEREGDAVMFLSKEEMAHWMPIMAERLDNAVRANPKFADDDSSKKINQELFAEAIFPVFSEMTEEVFTPQRIQELIGELKTYRDEQFANGKTKDAHTITAMASLLEHEKEPKFNRFLVSVCITSIFTRIQDEM